MVNSVINSVPVISSTHHPTSVYFWISQESGIVTVYEDQLHTGCGGSHYTLYVSLIELVCRASTFGFLFLLCTSGLYSWFIIYSKDQKDRGLSWVTFVASREPRACWEHPVRLARVTADLPLWTGVLTGPCGADIYTQRQGHTVPEPSMSCLTTTAWTSHVQGR